MDLLLNYIVSKAFQLKEIIKEPVEKTCFEILHPCIEVELGNN